MSDNTVSDTGRTTAVLYIGSFVLFDNHNSTAKVVPRQLMECKLGQQRKYRRGKIMLLVLGMSRGGRTVSLHCFIYRVEPSGLD